MDFSSRLSGRPDFFRKKFGIFYKPALLRVLSICYLRLMTFRFKSLALALMGLLANASAVTQEKSEPEGIAPEIQAWIDGLKFETGDIPIGGVAEAHVPEGYRYLNPKDASKYLTLLGNPPSEVLGILFRKDRDLFADENGWFVVLQYEEEGHVKDDDAAKIDYNDLMRDMQDASIENNKARAEEGYGTVQLVGWAATPHYDASSHKLYWAKNLKFSDSSENTLNYNIRMLGREGVLVANAVGSMSHLEEIEASTPDILSMVNFKAGHRYEDFNEKTDRVAEYGIAGLVAGAAGLKIAAKAGLLAVIGKKLALLWKPIAIAGAFLIGSLKKLFGKKASA
jgi:uncharacterized membrane-anchored protein